MILLSLLTCLSWAQPVPITLQDVVEKVSKENYRVYEGALRVYQAKTNIEKARGDLLPRLNLWSLYGMITDPSSIIENIPDVAPFLVPEGWFRLQQVKILHLAEQEGYRALWGNELHIAKSLYLNILLDQQLYRHLVESIAELERIHRIVDTREKFGGARPGTARDIRIRILALQADLEKMRLLLAQEHDSLSYILGLPAKTELTLAAVPMLDPSALPELKEETHHFRVLSVSPERRQYEHFFSVLKQIRKEFRYSFLGSSPISRGVAGGVFDGLPQANGLSMGNGAGATIVDAQREVMKIQQKGIEETLLRQLRELARQYNSNRITYGNVQSRLDLAKASRTALGRRVQLGEDVHVLELYESSRQVIQAQAELLSAQVRALTLSDRLQRLTMEGDYAKNPPVLDSVKEAK